MAGCKVIGIFGGVGSGKSEASKYLKRKYNAYLIQADEMAHRLYKTGQPGYKAVIRICGKKILDVNRHIDRAKLSEMLYNDPQLLSEINASIHPMVYRKTSGLISEYKKRHYTGMIIYEAALLPSDKAEFLDKKWYIYTPLDIRIQRLKDTRGYSEEKSLSIIRNQPSEAEYKEFCDYVIFNDNDLKKMEEQIDEIIKHS